MSFYKGLLFVSLAVLFHAAFSVAEWRGYSRRQSAEDGEASLPADIVLQTVVALAMAMVAVLNIAGDFKEIRATVELSAKTWEHCRNRPSFYTYNHRGRTFSPEYMPPRASSEVRKMGGNNQQIPERFLS